MRGKALKYDVVLGVSGGVDSSVSAYMLKSEGYSVLGLYINMGRSGEKETEESAESVCAKLSIDFQVVDESRDFRATVIEDYLNGRLKGRTPNPCIVCNEKVKFESLARASSKYGAQLIATGHYARVSRSGTNVRLLKGIDRAKDQSYVLYRIKRGHLVKAVFPIGGLLRREVESVAEGKKLPHFKRPSHDLCFAEGDPEGFLLNNVPEASRRGEIVNLKNEVIGFHEGTARYTIGQRRGLGIAAGHPLYVLDVDAENERLILGTHEEGLGREMKVSDLEWLTEPEEDSFNASIKIRSTMEAVDCEVFKCEGKSLRVKFKDEQWGFCPGQSAVIYKEEEVMGGGFIEGRCDWLQADNR